MVSRLSKRHNTVAPSPQLLLLLLVVVIVIVLLLLMLLLLQVLSIKANLAFKDTKRKGSLKPSHSCTLEAIR